MTLHRAPPPAPTPYEPNLLESIAGAVGLSAFGVLYLKAKITGGGGSRWGGSRGGSRGRSGYAALTPSLKRVREVSLAPAVTPDGVHGGISLRW